MKRAMVLGMAAVGACFLAACSRQDTGMTMTYDPNLDGVKPMALLKAPDTSILDDQRKSAPTPAAAAAPAPAASASAPTPEAGPASAPAADATKGPDAASAEPAKAADTAPAKPE